MVNDKCNWLNNSDKESLARCTCIPSLVGVVFQVSEILFLFVDLQMCLKFPLPKNRIGSKNLCK